MPVPPFGRAKYEPINARDWVDKLALATHGMFTSPERADPPDGIASVFDIMYPIGKAIIPSSQIPFPIASFTVGHLKYPIGHANIQDIKYPIGTADKLGVINFPFGIAEIV